MSTAAESLCLSCGLCCNGGLFTLVPLTTSEVAAAGTGMLRIVQRPDGSSALRQPCDAHAPSGCRVYATRPSACRRFECLLLIALREDEVSAPDAAAIVERTLLATGAERESLIRRYFISQRGR
jgi:hypothetical protein